MSIYGKSILESYKNQKILNEGFISDFIKKRVNRIKRSKKKDTDNKKKELATFYFTSKDKLEIGNKLSSDLISFYNKYPGQKAETKQESLSDYLIDYKGPEGFFYTKDDKPDFNKTLYIYKINKEYIVEELPNSDTLEELMNSILHSKMSPVNEYEATNRKRVYDYTISRLKELSKNCKLSNKHLEIGKDVFDDYYTIEESMREFLYPELSKTRYINILSGDLWEMNPNARTDTDLNNKIYKEIKDMINIINNELKTKFNDKFTIEFAGDWDGILYDLVEKRK